MASMPGPRTNPTVKSLASTNQRDLRSWRLSLGPVQTVILAGVVTGCMACAFYLGFFSGQKVGIETALNNSLSSAMRLPIEGLPEESSQDRDENASDVYAKLNDSSNESSGTIVVQHAASGAAVGKGAHEAKEKMPELGEIPSTDSAPVADALQGERGAQSGSEVAKLGLEAGEDNSKVRVLGEKPAFGFEDGGANHNAAGKTLGALEREAQGAGLAKKSAEAQRDQIGKASFVVKAETPQVLPTAMPTAKMVEKKSEAVKISEKSGSQNSSGGQFIAAVLPKGWYAQISAPKSQSEAEGIARRLKSSGFSVLIENAVVRGDNYYRVLAGPEDSREHAERLISQLRRESYIKSDPFLRAVK